MINSGPNTIDDGLVLYFDQGNAKSYPGEPTTNLCYSYDPTLTSYNWWNNAGLTLVLTGDTTIEKPFVGWNILSMLKTTADGISTINISSYGSTTGYTTNSYLYADMVGSGQTIARAVFVVTSVDANGKILSLAVSTNGAGYVIGASLVFSFNYGPGTGCESIAATVAIIGGSSQIGPTSANITTGTTYSVSVYFWQNRTIGQGAAPYIRPQPENTSRGLLEYNGNNNWDTWPQRKWIRIKKTFTSSATNVTFMYISSYLTLAGDKIAYYAPQVELKPHTTQFTGPPRLSVSGLTDVSKHGYSCNLTGATYDSNAKIYFDGTYYLSVNVDSWIRSTTYVTVCGWYYYNTFSSSGPFSIMTNTSPLTDADGFWFHLDYNNSGSTLLLRTEDSVNGEYDFSSSTFSCVTGNTYYVACIVGANRFKIYRNGILNYDWNGTTFSWSNINSDTAYLYIGASYPSYRVIGRVDSIAVYNRMLSPSEILKNYNNTKKRFILP